MEKQKYIYQTTNLINGKKYIGKHIGYINDDYLGSGIILNKAISKYGKENFKKEILEIVNNDVELNEREKFYIKLYNAVQNPQYYNIAQGGQGGLLMKGYSEKEKKKIYEQRQKYYKKENHPMYGKHHSEETKQKIKDSLAKYWTEQKRKERSNQYKGENNPMYGKHKSLESIQKQVAHTDYQSYRTEEYRKKMSEATSGEKNGNYGNVGEKAKNGKHIFMYDSNHILIKKFNTKRLALQFLKVKGHSSLDNAIKNKTLYKNYYWEQN